jgi:hypothetical protein
MLGKTDMFVLVNLFYGSIEHGTQAVGCISAMLGNPNVWLVTLCMGQINCHTLYIFGVILSLENQFLIWRFFCICQSNLLF